MAQGHPVVGWAVRSIRRQRLDLASPVVAARFIRDHLATHGWVEHRQSDLGRGRELNADFIGWQNFPTGIFCAANRALGQEQLEPPLSPAAILMIT